MLKVTRYTFKEQVKKSHNFYSIYRTLRKPLYSRKECLINQKSIRKFVFASLLWQQYACKYQKFEEIEGFISETSSVTTIF